MRLPGQLDVKRGYRTLTEDGGFCAVRARASRGSCHQASNRGNYAHFLRSEGLPIITRTASRSWSCMGVLGAIPLPVDSSGWPPLRLTTQRQL